MLRKKKGLKSSLKAEVGGGKSQQIKPKLNRRSKLVTVRVKNNEIEKTIQNQTSSKTLDFWLFRGSGSSG